MSELGWAVGAVRVTPVVERATAIPAAAFFPSATDTALAAHDWLQPWALTPAGEVRIVIQALGVESAGRRILVDTCVGQRPLPEPFSHLADDGGFLTALTAAGFGPDEVDVVVCTHLHFDHVGWNTTWDGTGWVPTFPNARYVLARTEYEHWRDAGPEAWAAQSAVSFADAVLPLVDAGVVDLVDPDHAITDDVALMPTPGHSPGHVSVRIRSGGAEACITGDCVHSPVQLAEPDWFTRVDHDRARSSATRHALVAECCDRDVLVIGTHFPPPTAGHLVTGPGGGVRFRPLA
ncbi:MAG: MBL fold metallo-hydrolase [Actinobacteria bacterium]|nr:MBL fold metallo-hydrolase [Actinomycetota bacterium]